MVGVEVGLDGAGPEGVGLSDDGGPQDRPDEPDGGDVGAIWPNIGSPGTADGVFTYGGATGFSTS